MYIHKQNSEQRDSSHNIPLELIPNNLEKRAPKILKYASWTTEKLRSTAVRVLKEFLEEAPPCYKTYPNVCYYLAFLGFSGISKKKFKEYCEQGQDAEEKRLPFLDPVDIPLKDTMSTFYQLFGNV